MTRVLATLAVAAVAFCAGYWGTDLYESRRIWRDDALIAQPTTEIKSRTQPRAANRQPSSQIVFEDVALGAGLDFTYYDGAAGNYYIIETIGGGMAVMDFDGDGNQDICFVNGSRLPTEPTDRTHISRLFRNCGESGFDDVTETGRVDMVAYGNGATAADYDNDGFPDLLVTTFGHLVLYHNNGDGTFSDVTVASRVASPLWGTSAAFADLDGDGAVDLYVCTYADVALDNPLVCGRAGQRMHCFPRRYRAQHDLLFRNQSDGTFVEVSDATGIVDDNGRGLGLAIADFDSDNRPDIFVANDTSENFLFVNQGDFHFRDDALSLGVALSGEGSTMSGMGVACGDYDLNGMLDLVVTNFYQDKTVLYQNSGKNGFVDSADAAGLGAPSRDRLGFGTVFLDADLDGFPDLFVANGHVSDMSPVGIPYKMRQQLFRNEGGNNFLDCSDSAGAYFHSRLLGRGVATLDVNNDGRPDLVVSHILDPAALLINRSFNHGHWLGLQLVGTQSNRDGTNAKVRVTVNGQERTYELIAGGGYLSSSDKRLLIGLGQTATIEGLVVHWPSGKEQRLDSLPTDQYHRLIEPTDDEMEFLKP